MKSEQLFEVEAVVRFECSKGEDAVRIRLESEEKAKKSGEKPKTYEI